MHSDALSLWRGRRWTLTLLIACLSMLGPFSIDTYLPAFAGIGASIDATPAQMQQTLSSYLLGFSLMNLFHGALSDSFGRRPVILVGAAVFTVASIGCALSGSIATLVAFRGLQGLSAGAGMVVSRAIIRDLYAPADAQRAMSQVTLYFAIAPAVAPLLGGWVFAGFGWHAVFWMLAVLGALLGFVVWRRLPETLHAAARQPLHLLHLLRGYAQLVRSPRFLALVVASGVPFNGMFMYVLAAPAFVGRHLGLAPTQFFWFFAINVAGIMGGAWLSGRMAGRISWRRQIRWGFVVMSVVSVLNVALNYAFEPHAYWAMWPIGLYAFGWSLMTPVVTLLVLEQVPERRGMASSVHSSISSAANALVAGALTPLVMDSPRELALAALVLMATGLVSWTWVKRQVT